MNETLLQKIQSCQRYIRRARDIYSKHQEDFAANFDAQDAAVLEVTASFLIRRDTLGSENTAA